MNSVWPIRIRFLIKCRKKARRMSRAMPLKNTKCRPVSRRTAVDIFTQPVYFGVSDDGYYFYDLNKAVQFPLIALDRNEKILNGVQARVQVIKQEYRTVLTKSGSYF